MYLTCSQHELELGIYATEPRFHVETVNVDVYLLFEQVKRAHV